MKRIMVLTALVLLALGMLSLAGCGKKVTRQADVANGDYYTEEEFKNLSKDQRDSYCAQIAQAQSEINANQDEVMAVQEQIDYFESLPANYSVVRGDCLWNISGQEAIYADPIKWPRIYRANRDQIENPNLIYPGQVFAVPRNWPSQHTVIRDEWLSKIAGYWEVYDNFREWPRLYEANRDQINDPDLIHPGQVLDIPR